MLTRGEREGRKVGEPMRGSERREKQRDGERES